MQNNLGEFKDFGICIKNLGGGMECKCARRGKKQQVVF